MKKNLKTAGKILLASTALAATVAYLTKKFFDSLNE